jgi:peptidoglycan/xylan/chitin deacetylase (PgdA/CDA1 family)
VRRALASSIVLVLAGCGSHAVVSPKTTAPTTTTRPVPLPKPKARRRRVSPHHAPVPILMYHVIGVPAPTAPNRALYVSPRDFAAQLRWLHARGYHAVTLHRVYEYWHQGYALPPRPIVLSFDDGYPQDLTKALPALRARRWPAVLNLQIGNLTPARVRTLMRYGWEIDAHTFTHPDLTTLDAPHLHREVAGARIWIRDVLHVPVLFFCYPSGRYDARVVSAVRRAGYVGATTTEFGLARPSDGIYRLRRIPVDGTKGLRDFVAALEHAE